MNERNEKADWNALKIEYVTSSISYRELAKKHDVSFHTLAQTAKRENWADERQKRKDKAVEKAIEAAAKVEAKEHSRIEKVADKLLQKIMDRLDSATLIDSSAIRQLASALKDIKDIKNIKSDADTREQEARIKKLLKDAEKTDEKTNEIEVVFNAGEASWNE